MIADIGGKRFRRKASTVMTEINVTPFVDVMLVLLIIFMVTAPLLQSGVSVDLPKQESGSLEISEGNVVSMRKDGDIFLNDKRVSVKQLAVKLKTMAQAKASTQIFLRADKALPYGVVMEVMGVIKKSGVRRLGMVTEIAGRGEVVNRKHRVRRGRAGKPKQ